MVGCAVVTAASDADMEVRLIVAVASTEFESRTSLPSDTFRSALLAWKKDTFLSKQLIFCELDKSVQIKHLVAFMFRTMAYEKKKNNNKQEKQVKQ